MEIKTVREFLVAVRLGSFTSVGGYPLFFITADGEALSVKAAHENAVQIGRAIRDHDNAEWRVIGHDVNWEDPALFCADTNKRIESAYAEDQAENA